MRITAKKKYLIGMSYKKNKFFETNKTVGKCRLQIKK